MQKEWSGKTPWEAADEEFRRLQESQEAAEARDQRRAAPAKKDETAKRIEQRAKIEAIAELFGISPEELVRGAANGGAQKLAVQEVEEPIEQPPNARRPAEAEFPGGEFSPCPPFGPLAWMDR
jgi:hypothetical protein